MSEFQDLIIVSVDNNDHGVITKLKHGEDEWTLKINVMFSGTVMQGKSIIMKNGDIVESFDGYMEDDIQYLRNKLYFEYKKAKEL